MDPNSTSGVPVLWLSPAATQRGKTPRKQRKTAERNPNLKPPTTRHLLLVFQPRAGRSAPPGFTRVAPSVQQ